MTRDDLLAAIELALAGDWEGAHGIVQQDEADRTAAWIHAVLHKIEGDPGNARDGLWRRLGEDGQAALTRPFVAGPDGFRADYAVVVGV